MYPWSARGEGSSECAVQDTESRVRGPRLRRDACPGQHAGPARKATPRGNSQVHISHGVTTSFLPPLRACRLRRGDSCRKFRNIFPFPQVPQPVSDTPLRSIVPASGPPRGGKKSFPPLDMNKYLWIIMVLGNNLARIVRIGRGRGRRFPDYHQQDDIGKDSCSHGFSSSSRADGVYAGARSAMAARRKKICVPKCPEGDLPV